MDATTIARLNQINRDFYRTVAGDFDQTRGQPWPGWERLLGYLRGRWTEENKLNYRGTEDTERETDSAQLLKVISVLDVGCGNGRFGVFLRGATEWTIHYHGLDNNPALLERAQVALSGLSETRLEERDIVANPPDSGAYDLVALFGVLHHIPGVENRLALIRILAERVAPAGILAFACWRFYEDERFKERILPWPDDLPVEPHDYLLDWRRGTTALRYCHYVDDAEHAALVEASRLCEIATYRADGAAGDSNRYSVLRRCASNS